MSRFVLRLERPVNGDPQIRMEEPLDHPDAETPFRINPQVVRDILDKLNKQPLDAGVMKDVGDTLLGLLASHTAIKDKMLPFLDHQSQVESPIYLMIRDPQLEQLPWEALYRGPCDFASTHRKWPIARARKQAGTRPDATFTPPLRVLAVLGASGDSPLTQLSAANELDSLLQAVDATRLNVRLQLLVCEEELKERVDAMQADWISADLLTDQTELYLAIRTFGPHILHFFCHGVANPTPRLEIASALTWARGESGSIVVEGADLHDRADTKDSIWLVTLNCCESAMPGAAEGSRSLALASALVNAGFPAAVGMRERVEVSLAHVFCHLFYDALFTELAQRFDAALKEAELKGGVRELHWACGLYAARQAICNNVAPGVARPVSDLAADLKEWTLPVLYARLQPFTVRMIPDPTGAAPLFRPPRPPVVAPQPPPNPNPGPNPNPNAQANPGPAANPNSSANGNPGAASIAHGAGAGGIAPAPGAPGAAALTVEEIRSLAAEMKELLALRESFKDLAPVVKKIDKRLGEIEQQLA